MPFYLSDYFIFYIVALIFEIIEDSVVHCMSVVVEDMATPVIVSCRS